MASKKKILLQLDTDPRPSSFDAVVAVDSGVEVLVPYSGIQPEDVRDLVYGAIFTRGIDSLRSTAIFVGGSDVALGEKVLRAAKDAFLGPLRVSLMLDSGGANTTAAAAVLASQREFGSLAGGLAGRRALVLGSTGPVGRRVVRLLARAGARVLAGSRSLDRATGVAEVVNRSVEGAGVEGVSTGENAGDDSAALEAALEGVELVVAAGGPRVCLLPSEVRAKCTELRVAIDLNAVPPEGIEGVEGPDSGVERDGVIAYGAIGVGGIKMKIHKASVAGLFESNDRILDAEEIFDLGRALSG